MLSGLTTIIKLCVHRSEPSHDTNLRYVCAPVFAITLTAVGVAYTGGGCGVSCEAERQIEGSADALKCLRCNGGASIITGGEWYQIASKRSEPDGQECVRPDTLKLGDHAFSIDSETVASEMREEMLDFMEAYNGQEIPSHFFQYNTTMPDMD